ncbi:hypothetical protein LCGC14_3038340 [marine sediment metagenome]|uniref:Uncharacterized protein n=1 Tax=marine sediment metagenome TaxID=412755 RepID=A0A0F8YYB6_9ZZZZ
MKKEIKKRGNSYGIIFTPEERRIYGLVQGSIVDLTDMVVLPDKTSHNPLEQEFKGNKKEDEIKAHKETMAWLAKPITSAVFAKAMEKGMPRLLLSKLLDCPPSSKISFTLSPQAMKGLPL